VLLTLLRLSGPWGQQQVWRLRRQQLRQRALLLLLLLLGAAGG
jgi:hypothetical protein